MKYFRLVLIITVLFVMLPLIPAGVSHAAPAQQGFQTE